MPTTILIEIQRPEILLQLTSFILQIEEVLYMLFETQLGEEGYYLFNINNKLNI